MAPRKFGIRSSHVVALGLALSLSVQQTAAAAVVEPAEAGQTAEERVKAKYDEGSALYSAADYDGAIAVFTEALKIVTIERMDATVRGALLLNLAKAHVNAYDVDHDPSHIRQAKSIYLRFIKESESEGVYDEKDVDAARTHVTELEAILEDLKEEEPEGPNPVAAETPQVDNSAKAKKLKTGGIVGIVGGIVFIGGAAGMAIYGTSFRRSYEDDIEASGQDPADFKDEIDAEASRGALVGGLGGGLFGVIGVAGLVTGIVLLMKSKGMSDGSTTSLVPTFTPEYAGFSLTQRF
jgi:hypothetical protein